MRQGVVRGFGNWDVAPARPAPPRSKRAQNWARWRACGSSVVVVVRRRSSQTSDGRVLTRGGPGAMVHGTTSVAASTREQREGSRSHFLVARHVDVREVVGLDPELTAVGARGGVERGARGQAEPAPLLEGVGALGGGARDDEELAAAREVERDRGVGFPELDAHVLGPVAEEGDDRDARAAGRGDRLHLVGIDDDVRPVAQVELVELDEDDAAVVGPRSVLGRGRVADVASLREVAGLVRERSAEDEELLAARVRMLAKL
mmetsp:Transcript_11490/g.36513  ORF Transcript_11490/g.36513 Transcript_11490/m.36513 type:complete len:261 (+) Transcript_11490:40-822(+)